MTRKHFTMIAAVIAEIEDKRERHNAAVRFAFVLPSYNPNFNRYRFLEACGVDTMSEKTNV